MEDRMSASSTHHLRSVLGAILAVVTMSFPARATESVPVISGKTVIHSDGTGGVRLRIPDKLVLDEADITLEADGPTFVVMGPASIGGTCNKVRNSARCVDYLIDHVPDREGLEVWVSTPSPPVMNAGLFDVYIVSSGPVTLEIRPRGLPGLSFLEVTAQIDATMERLPARCLSTVGCHRHAFGGVTHTVRAPALVVVGVWAVLSRNEPRGLIASNAIRGCLYPYDDAAASTDPQDYPYGCNVLNESGSLHGIFNNIARHATYLLNAIPGHDMASRSMNYYADGPQYTGYMAHSYAVPEESGRVGAYGLWLNIGMVCPSGDFSAC